MATDYDAPRRTETDDVSEDSLEELKARRNEAQSAVVDVDESESAESFELPGADLSGAGDPEAGRRVHVLQLFLGASPQPIGQREERRDDLHRLRGLGLQSDSRLSRGAQPAPSPDAGSSPASTASDHRDR